MNRINIASFKLLTGAGYARRQAGTALFIVLMILLLISIIGVAGIRSVVMEKNMATNNQYEMMVFQGAESAIEGVLVDDDVFVEAINTASGDPAPTRTFTLDHGSNSFNITSSASVTAGTATIPVGYTLGDFVSYPFTINSSASIASINASDTHIQTASKIAPYLF
ncbi:MAG: PilX N-terminal domain-containing pilus assembly protein [Gammaproteobacteria bacterium]